jgi:Fe2+ transport system protein FeoA
MVPGVGITVEERQPFEGPLTVRVDNGADAVHVVGVELARRIFVTEVE